MNKLTRAAGALAVVTAATFPVSGLAHASPNTQAPSPPQPGHGSGGGGGFGGGSFGGGGGGSFGGGGGPFGGGLSPRQQQPVQPPVQAPVEAPPPVHQPAPGPVEQAPAPPAHQPAVQQDPQEEPAPPVHKPDPPAHQPVVQQDPQEEPAPPVHKPDPQQQQPAPAHGPQQQQPVTGGSQTDGPMPPRAGGSTDPAPGQHTGSGIQTDGPMPPHAGGSTTDPHNGSTAPNAPVPAHTGPGTQTDGPLPRVGGQTPTGGSPGPQAPRNDLQPAHSEPGQQTTVINRNGGTQQVPVAASPRGVEAASHEAVEAARNAPPSKVDALSPPPVREDFNHEAEHAIRANVDHDESFVRPRHWDYIDYDEYRRPRFINPTEHEMSFKYFYGGDYRTVVVPVGGNVVLDAAIAGVYPITVITGDIISAATFVGGAFIPPDGWDGPPPPDWAPYQPVVYDSVPVDFVNADEQTAVVDRVTMVGHDDTLPEGQRDVFTINDSTLARGQVTPAPEGGPPQVKVQQTQPLPGVSPWNDGKQYVNTQVTPLAASHRNLAPWAVGGLGVVLALLAGIAAWVWKHPRGAHAVSADAPTEWYGGIDDGQWRRP